MEKVAETTYRYYIEKCRETSTLFGFIPMVSGNSFFFYMFILILSVFLDATLNTYYILPLVGFILIAEYRRLDIMRETILDSCMCDEICLIKELQENKEYLDRIHEDTIVLQSDRENIFTDNLIYSNSRSRLNYIKNHYGFLISIMVIQFLLYLFFVTYTN